MLASQAMVGRSLGRPPKKLTVPRRAAIRRPSSWAAPEAAATMTSAPRPPVSPRDAVDAVDGQHRGRDAHELGEAAVVLVADPLLVGADRRPAVPLLVAGAVGDGRDDLHPVAHRPAVGGLADLDHLAGALVAE